MEEIEKIREGSTQYNSNLDILQRINKLWEEANLYSRETNNYPLIKAWYAVLQAIDREISPYLTTQEVQELTPYRNITIMDTKRMKVTPSFNISRRLDEYERKLRQFHAKKGMGMIGKDMEQVFFLPGKT
jgi:hypothetical protein